MSKSQGKGGRGKQNLTFVRQVPRFLQHTLKDEPDISSKTQIVNAEFAAEPDEEYNDLLADKEEERPQIVVLNKFNDITEEEATKHSN
ncbi:hypothetical protein DSO57_1020135 [Entomophthora muscae]|uniref:Uncharacterized protein n=1 Tax=Entomophthora muscae TaxID=34485 RepID=A0ACC2TEI5_9FUNG|nr:hypothetical protein DSO57_1020135 [Entomophthora muscae]